MKDKIAILAERAIIRDLMGDTFLRLFYDKRDRPCIDVSRERHIEPNDLREPLEEGNHV